MNLSAGSVPLISHFFFYLIFFFSPFHICITIQDFKNPTFPKFTTKPPNNTIKKKKMDKGKHFVLVHGSCHGAWCWYKLSSLLKLAGHRVTALDLGASGVNPKRLDEVPAASDYVAPLMELMASLPDQVDQRVVLVGHSYAGLCISLAMESFPQKISIAVFLTAYMPHYNSPPGILIQEVSKISKIDANFYIEIVLFFFFFWCMNN